MRNKQRFAINKSTIPAALQPWLFAPGSLTKQLTDLAGGKFKVEPIQQHFERLNFHDAQWMNLPYQHTSWVRDAYLYGCEHQAWVRAKSIFPILSLQKRARIFQHLGTRPIGFFLFQRTQPLCERRVVWLEDGWTRQSCYTWHGCKFIVQETFLAQFEKFLAIQHSSFDI
ncbi:MULTISPECIES: chorismate--pyruvate lyase family protein [unclassified Acinetobacter]|uniref:chorismate--pyruvate lyase family protein n=1 Tax=unclassified Acinetobacter TaxID=196816 RepID=UPI00293448BA|nr:MULTISPECIES: chorismate lyase [unclassified Acinetobacter]WOE32702.1 chorismate lyase [Acinetobacter sp. SAAs470]WOE38178.1 chorismate lyase [Acinetobacter sp. SAAs474]